VAALIAVVSASPALAQQMPPPRGAGVASPLPAPVWVVSLGSQALHAAPEADSDELKALRPYAYLEVKSYSGDWAQVLEPRSHVVGYVPSDAIGPTDEAPPEYLTAAAPPAVDEIAATGRAVRGAVLSFYPTDEPAAAEEPLAHNTPVTIADTVEGDDGALWYRTADGDYLPEAAVRLPRTPARTFTGRWIDADLKEPAMLTAYEDDQPVLTTLTIHGAGARPTPVGLFRIIRRVANETMNSDTIGIPRFGPGGYYLTNVLFTQYFTPDGASLHYNYWSSNWGFAASHGCLGLTYADSAFLWSWATLGTPVYVHY
jgi:L,D-transpeptidase catalytic domain